MKLAFAVVADLETGADSAAIIAKVNEIWRL